ncbi:MAG: PEP-CTERM sorting domain-containing protein [Candidatus Hydrogenedentes bacterium]|nr:PEP-CTERM sorting domain-containing protein [Candidatus Hydrogenedentota bacterium]
METAEASSSYVQLFNGGSSIGSATFTQLDQYYDPSLHFGDNSINRITPFDLTSLGLGEADSVRIHFSGSGAVDNISFTQGVVPEPATMTLLGMGLGGLAVARRRRNAKQK